MSENKPIRPTFIAEFPYGSDSFYKTVLRVEGEKKTPKFLKLGCLGIITIPIVAVSLRIIDSIFGSGAGREHIPMYCGAALGLMYFGIITGVKKAINRNKSN